MSLRLHALPLVLLAPLAFTACTEDPPVDDPNGGFDVARSDAPHDEDPQLTATEIAALTADNHALALDLYHAVRDGQSAGKGFSVSPYSIQAAFGMLYGGTVDPARTEIADVIRFSLEGDRQHVANNWIDAQLASRNLPELTDETGTKEPVILETANGVWVLDDLQDRISASFLDLLATHYDAGLFLADFDTDPETERKGINAWVANKTRDLIPELIPAGIISVSTRMVLVNAFYLKAPWNEQFRAEQTATKTFTRGDGTPTEVQMMRNGELWGSYSEGAGYQAVAIPMRGHALELVVILPDDLASFEASLDVETLDAVLAGLTPKVVDTSLPRFELEAELELTEEMRDLGMVAPFVDASSFDDILDNLGIITAIIHKTVIKVDEKGTEAAAATAIVIDEASAPEVEATIVIDRPFVLAIRDQPTNTILFLGRVLDPMPE